MSRSEYFPEIFLPADLARAKDIILTSDPLGEKWLKETETTVHAMVEAFANAQAPLNENTLLLDYGCGIGRMAKKLIEITHCQVIGADISPAMLYHSVHYVNSEKFTPTPQPQISVLTKAGLRVDAAIAVWALQHCFNPADDIALIHNILKPNGLFFVVNKYARYLPVKPVAQMASWYDDKIDVLECLNEKFELLATNLKLSTPADDYYNIYRRKS